MTREELVHRMSIAEFVEWQILEAIEPFGDRRADIHAGIIAATIANVNRASNTPAFTPYQFVEHLYELDKLADAEVVAAPSVKQREMSDEQLIAFMHALVKSTNRTKKKPN